MNNVYIRKKHFLSAELRFAQRYHRNDYLQIFKSVDNAPPSANSVVEFLRRIAVSLLLLHIDRQLK